MQSLAASGVPGTDIALEQLFACHPSAMLLVDEGGTVQLANGAAAMLFARPVPALQGQGLAVLFPASHAQLASALRDCLLRPASATTSCSWSLPGRGQRWLRTQFRRMGELVLMCTSEIPREEMQGQFLNVVLDSLHDGIIACDMDGRAVFHNRPMTELLGLPEHMEPAHWLQHLEFRGCDGLTTLEASELPMRRALRGETVLDSEITIVTREGRLRHTLATAIPLHDARGEQLGAVASVHDITRRKAVEQQLQQIVKMEAIGQLTGGLAHDFNNLLAVILGNLQLLESALPPDPAVRRRFNAALDSGHRGARLIRQLLTFARRQALEPREVDLLETLEGFLDMLGRALGGQFRLTLQTQHRPGRVLVDPSLLESSLLNLVVNARDAMSEGGEVTIALDHVDVGGELLAGHPGISAGSWALIQISDTGSGMPPEVRERALEPFFTTKETGKGSGLGLPMVYGFVTQSGGHLTIDSEPGRGTTIRLYLPVAEGGGDMMATTGTFRQPGLKQPSGHHEKILLVEDDRQVREVAAMVLEDLGYQVLQAGDGDSALRQVEQHPDIALLLTDVVMPGSMLGPDLARRVAADHPGIKVLFTSGYAEQTLAGRDFDRQAVLLTKPWRAGELARAVRQALDA